MTGLWVVYGQHESTPSGCISLGIRQSDTPNSLPVRFGLRSATIHIPVDQIGDLIAVLQLMQAECLTDPSALIGA